MIPFTHKDQAGDGDDAHCPSCGWTGDASQVKYLAGEPRCPAMIEDSPCVSEIVLLEEDDPVDR